MNIRRDLVVLLGPLLFLSGLADQRSSAATTAEVLARVHWLGIEQISANTNSTHFMSVWRLPQTTALVAQTLDKFSRWPGGGAPNAAGALLRPLLDGLVASESYWELRASTNPQPATNNLQVFLAVHLPADRARLWQTNLAAAVETLTGGHPVSTGTGWFLVQSHAPERIELSRVGEWTLVGWGPETNDLLTTFAARIAHNHAPSATNLWLEADLNLSRLIPRLETLNSELLTLDDLHLAMMNEGGNVLTRGTFYFSRPLDLLLSPWVIPTNFIHGPLTGFTAARGFAPWLAAMPLWQKTRFGPPPDQACFWAQDGIPFQTYFVAPVPAASNQIWQLADHLVHNANPWLATNGEGNFQWTTNPPHLVWNDAFIISPYLIPVTLDHRNYVLGGLYPLAGGNPNPLPAEIRRTVLDTTNLVYYQTELTGARVEEYLFITQLFRVVFHKPQLPVAAAATEWLKHVEPLLGVSTTLVTQTGADQLTFTRKSTIGFTALELHLLADWVESPRFPHGLHTFVAPPDKRP